MKTVTESDVLKDNQDESGWVGKMGQENTNSHQNSGVLSALPLHQHSR